MQSDHSKGFQLYADGCDSKIAGVLMQKVNLGPRLFFCASKTETTGS